MSINSNAIIVKNTIRNVSLFDQSVSGHLVSGAINTKDFKFIFLKVTYKDNTGGDNKLGITTDTLLSWTFYEDVVSVSDGKTSKYVAQDGRTGTFIYRCDVRYLDKVWVNLQFGSATSVKIEYFLSQNKDEYFIPDGVSATNDAIYKEVVFNGTQLTGTRYYSVDVSRFKFLYLLMNWKENTYPGTGYYNRIGVTSDKALSAGYYEILTGITDGSSGVLAGQDGRTGNFIYRVDVRKLSTAFVVNSFTSATSIKLDMFLSQSEYEFANYYDRDRSTLFETDKIIALESDFKKLVDAFNDIVITEANGTTLKFQQGRPTLSQTTYFVVDTTTFSPSTIRRAWIVPFDPNGKDTNANYRICVQMADTKIYHNGDTGATRTAFHESALWDIADGNKRFPTKDSVLAAGTPSLYRFDPTLPDFSYNLPDISEFPLQKTETVQYENSYNTETVRFNRFSGKALFEWLGALCRTPKATFLGTYDTGNMDIRMGVWMTTDGGRNWYLKKDFVGSSPEGGVKPSSAINTSVISSNYVSDTLELVSVVVNAPTDAIKEPTHKYNVSAAVSVASISKASPCVITTAANHGIAGFSIVGFKAKGNAGDYSFMANPNLSESNLGTNLYWAQRLSNTTLALYEYCQSLDGDLSARHVHAVNDIKDGILISTGETHPNGWMIWGVQKAKDGSAIVDAKNPIEFIRLNSSEHGLQRSCGSTMFGESDPYILFGSDNSFTAGQKINIPDRTINIDRSSNGIFKGRLSDIDDFSKWRCVADIPEPVIYMHRQDNIVIAGLQLGGFVLSTDQGETWDYFRFKWMPKIYGIFNNKIIISINPAYNEFYEIQWK